jgi:hypothetical protein
MPDTTMNLRRASSVVMGIWSPLRSMKALGSKRLEGVSKGVAATDWFRSGVGGEVAAGMV